MIAVTLSNRAQFAAFQKADLDASSVRIYCDDEHFFAELKRKSVGCQLLSEFQLTPLWKDINAWGCQTACRWISSSKNGGFFKTIDFASVFYLFFSHLLVQGLKNLHFARAVVESPDVQSVVVFESSVRKAFPEFSGNVFLNYFLKQLAEANGKSTIVLRSLDSAKSEVVPVRSARPIKTFIEKLYTLFSRPKLQRALWVFGSLMHLKSLLPELKRQKVPFFYYSRELDFGQLVFSICRGIPYYTRNSFSKAKTTSSEAFIREKIVEIQASLDNAAQQGLFIYHAIDLSDFVLTQIFGMLNETLGYFVPRLHDYEAVLARIPVTGLLTDEDYALRGGFLAAYLQSRKIQTYCVSHANTAVDFNIPSQYRVFGNSTTFVQSAYERDNYLARGWRPEKFMITGSPRYDRLSKATQSRGSALGRKLRLLYCTNSSVTEKHCPDNYGYLGHAIYSTESVTRPAADAIFEAVKGLPVELWLKPHNLEKIAEWENYVASMGAVHQTRFLRKQTSILSYFGDCDVMILSYWSSALIEAALAQIPVLFVDTNNLERPSVAVFASKGFCRIVKNASQLQAELKSLCFAGSDHAPKNANDVEYYLGKRDGHAAARIAFFLADRLEGTASAKKNL